MVEQSKKPQVFVCYAHKDEEWLSRLLMHLEPLQLQEQAEIWSDSKIELGEAWHESIQATLQQVRAAILLVSPAFLASKYIRNSELPVLLKNAKDRGVVILPILLGECLWRETKFQYPHSQGGTEELSLSAIQMPSSEPLNGLSVAKQDQVLYQIARRVYEIVTKQEQIAIPQPQPIGELEYPTGSVSLDCPFYIERKEDALCYQEMEKAAALLQVKAPRQMGKSSLILRVENQAKKQGYDTAWIDFQLLDKERDLESLEKFLKWFCVSATKKVGLSSQLFKDYWDSDLFGPKDNCDGYFREVLLAKRTNPLVLILEEVDNIFPYEHIAKGFFALLRAWHEAAKRREKAIEKLRLVLVYSTESYVVMETNSSPFNVGIPINLPEFTPEQVTDLAGRHGLIWGREEMEKLREMVGGHPYLVRLACYHIAKGDLTLDRILEMAPTDEGIYRDHFGRHLDTLERDSELKLAFQKVVASLQPVPLEKKLAFKLHGLGLVNLQSSPDHTINTVILRYDKLYRPYFSDRLSVI